MREGHHRSEASSAPPDPAERATRHPPSGPRRVLALLRRRRRALAWSFGVVVLMVGIYNVVRPLPSGASMEGPYRSVDELDFLVDLTYQRNGETVVEQEIFARIFEMIDSADRFVVVDMFLFNDEHGGDRPYPRLTAELTERIVRRRAVRPELAVVFTSDEINTFYGSYEPVHFTELRAAGVDLVLTDLTRLRDSNPTYSALWRTALQWFGSSGLTWLPHPLTSRGQEVTARSYLRMFNMKANHRKLIVTEDGCLLSSANPHDASGFHSNIAWGATGDVCNDVLESERGVARFSGTTPPTFAVDSGTRAQSVAGPAAPDAPGPAGGPSGAALGARVRFVSEGKIRTSMIEAFDGARAGESIDVAMFYLSSRRIVEALSRAADRGVQVRLILDPNKDAFGREKGGIPNRQVAWELDALDHVDVRWYDTRGEQFHTKLVVVRGARETVMFGGSANLTRRNLGDYNLEADLEVVVPAGHRVDREVVAYFDRMWENVDGAFTLSYEAYHDASRAKRLLYRFQEFTGLSSF